MDGDTAVEILLGGAHLDSDTETLQHLSAAEAGNVQADNLLLGTGADKLVSGGSLLLGLHHGVVHGGEVGLVDLDVVLAVLLNGLRLRQADAADLGVREHDGGDVGVVEMRILVLGASEQTLRQTTSRSNGDRGQLDLASDVAEGVDVLDAGVLVVVDGDVTLLVRLEAGGVDAEVLGRGRAANGPDEVVEAALGGLLAVGVLVGDCELALGVLLDLCGLGALVQVDAEALVLLGDGLLDHGVEVAQEGVVTDEEVGFGAEGVEHAGELDGDVAGADEGDLLGLDVDVEEAVRVGAELGAGDFRGDGGVAADGDEDLLGLDGGLGAVVEGDLGLVLAGQAGPAVEVLDLVVVEVALVDAVEALDVGVALVLEGRPVEGGRLGDGEAVRLGLVDRLGDGGGVEGDLFGDAAGASFMSDNMKALAVWEGEGDLPNVHAGSSQPRALDDHGLYAKLPAGLARRSEAAAAAADDEEVGLLGDGSHDAGCRGEVPLDGCDSRGGCRGCCCCCSGCNGRCAVEGLHGAYLSRGKSKGIAGEGEGRAVFLYVRLVGLDGVTSCMLAGARPDKCGNGRHETDGGGRRVGVRVVRDKAESGRVAKVGS